MAHLRTPTAAERRTGDPSGTRAGFVRSRVMAHPGASGRRLQVPRQAARRSTIQLHYGNAHRVGVWASGVDDAQWPLRSERAVTPPAAARSLSRMLAG